MLHYILAQVSIQLIFNKETIFPYSHVSLLQHWVHSTTVSLFFALVLLCFAGWFFNPFFPRGGVGCFPMCSQKFVKQTILTFTDNFLTFMHVFHFPGASAWWQQPNIGTTTRSSHTCGDSAVQIDFLRFGPRSSHSQLHFASFRSIGLETFEKFQRTLVVTVWVFISFSCTISSSATCSSPRISSSVKWPIGI